MPLKTNAIRLLEQLGIAYEVRTYSIDLEDLTARTVASKIGLPPQQVFKTLVVRGDRGGVYFAVVPASGRLNPKALAKLTGDGKVEPVHLADVQPLTGYVRGGVTVLGAKKAFPVYADLTIERNDVISISSGTRGMQLLLASADFVKIAQVTLAAIATVDLPEESED